MTATNPIPPPQTLTGFDVAHAVERMLGQPQLWWEAVGLFVEHFADWEEQWLAAQNNHDAERRCVHALYSSAVNVGAHQLSCVAACLEQLLRKRCAGNGTHIPPSIRWHLKDCFRETWRAAASARQLTLSLHP